MEVTTSLVAKYNQIANSRKNDAVTILAYRSLSYSKDTTDWYQLKKEVQ